MSKTLTKVVAETLKGRPELVAIYILKRITEGGEVQEKDYAVTSESAVFVTKWIPRDYDNTPKHGYSPCEEVPDSAEYVGICYIPSVSNR